MAQTTITGQVFDAISGEGLAGVIVSDGVTCTPSDEQGSYALTVAPAAEFLFVVTPPDYRALHNFWLDVRNPEQRPAQHNFALQPWMDSRPTRFEFVQVTDLHITTPALLDDNFMRQTPPATVYKRFTGGILATAVADDLAEILRRHPATAFFAITGDLTNLGTLEEFGAFQAAVQNLSVPIAPVVGNHDTMTTLLDLLRSGQRPAIDFGRIDQDAGYATTGGDSPLDPRSGRLPWLGTLGPAYYAFWWGDLHVIVYDGDGQGRQGARYPQENWLAAHLAYLPAATPILLLQHFPPSPRQLALFQGRRLVASTSGHWHCRRVLSTGQTAIYSTPTLAFGGIDYSPRGYRLFTWDGETLHSEFMRLDRPPQPTEVVATSPVFHQPVNAHGSWPQLGGGAQRSGQAAPLPPPLTLAWERSLAGEVGPGGPVVADGLVIVATGQEDSADGGRLSAYAVQDGALRWQQAVGASVKHSPAIANETVVVVTVDGRVSAWGLADGALRWSYQLASALERWCYSAPLIHADQVFTGSANCLVALDLATGKLLWERRDLDSSDWIASYACPAASRERIFVGFTWSKTALAALDARSGEIHWRLPGDIYRSPMASPVLVGEHVILVRGNGLLECLTQADGQSLWQTPLDATWTLATPVCTEDTVYPLTLAGTLTAHRLSDGAMLWQQAFANGDAARWPYRRTAGAQLGSPLLAGDWLYLPGGDGCLRAVNRFNGVVTWQADVGAPLASSLAAIDGALFVPTERCRLQAWVLEEV